MPEQFFYRSLIFLKLFFVLLPAGYKEKIDLLDPFPVIKLFSINRES